MISTITTTTITLAGSITIVGVIVLITLLVVKQLAASKTSERGKILTRALNIGIFPLLIAFGLIVISRVMAALH